MAIEEKNPQTEKDLALAKKMGRGPLFREPGESAAEYTRRLRITPKLPVVLTDEQIKLARDMHAVHSAMARGYVLPPLPVTDEQKAEDEARAQEIGVKPVERQPGEIDEDFNERLAASPRIDAVKEKPVDETIYPPRVDKPVAVPVERKPAPVGAFDD